MAMRKRVKYFLTKFNFNLEFYRTLDRSFIRGYRNLINFDNNLKKEYFSKEKVKKLHVGCGDIILKGWLNADYYPKSDKILYLDATKRFPFNNDEFDYIFCEHMIEHIAYTEGMIMLSECFRILKSGGKLRISTPDLQFLIGLYSNDKSNLQCDYIKWAIDTFIRYSPCYQDTFVINNFVRDWGHKFIYDEKVLRASLEKLGFTNITRCELNDSASEELRNLENESRMPDGFLGLESMVLEGTKR